ncbi:MAG: hypothetical protein ACRCUS_04480 [Anaerovoracaceae bacterium]
MAETDYKKLLLELTELIDEGVQIVDAEGKTIVYSNRIAALEKTKREDVLGKPYKEGFSEIPDDESTLLKALEKGLSTFDKKQVFFNKYGKAVNTMNTTIPIEKDGKIIAAMEIARESTAHVNVDKRVTRSANKQLEDDFCCFHDMIGES